MFFEGNVLPVRTFHLPEKQSAGSNPAGEEMLAISHLSSFMLNSIRGLSRSKEGVQKSKMYTPIFPESINVFKIHQKRFNLCQVIKKL